MLVKAGNLASLVQRHKGREPLIEHIVIDGSPEYPETWAELSSLLGRTWQHENGATMQIG